MNKENKIVLVIITFIVVCVVGYALFSDEVTVTGTATAKGSFDIEMTCVGGVSDKLWPYLISSADYEGSGDYYSFPKDNGFSNDSCQVSGNKLTFNVNLNYPGAVRYFLIKATNKGTITAGIEDSSAFYGGAKSNQTCIYNRADDSLVRCNNSSIAGTGSAIAAHQLFVAAEDKDGNLYGWDNSEIEEKYMDSSAVWPLKENESFYFVYIVTWETSWTDNSKYITYEMTGEFPFVQYIE